MAASRAEASALPMAHAWSELFAAAGSALAFSMATPVAAASAASFVVLVHR
ncbi:MAG: hypothetical protein M0Z29_07160 [Actinomycetota bacterium]|nr:hypothetical protein [Actinomycetota bacterium]